MVTESVTKSTDEATVGSARASLVALRQLRVNGRYDPDRDRLITDLETFLQERDGFVDPEGTIYDSRALIEADWHQGMLADGWQFLKREAGVIYIRRRYVQP